MKQKRWNRFMITTHILTKNNEATIQECIESVKPLGGEIIVYDLGSDDRTLELCRRADVWPKRITTLNFGALRNKIADESKLKWQFYLEPWEVLQTGHEEIKKYAQAAPKVFNFRVLEEGSITPQARLWNKKLGAKFVNPVYEVLDQDGIYTDHVIYVNPHQNQYDILDLVEQWAIREPASNIPLYYKAITLLSQREYEKFETAAQHYLFKEAKALQNVTMVKYYYALVLCYIKKDAKKATENIVSCLAANTLMAEFWCLLGDIHYTILQDYKKASQFYHNAIRLGAKRLKNDGWPMDISKYKDHPNKMMTSCEQILDNTSIIAK